jgi:chorismate mutase/prephenate dehydratase
MKTINELRTTIDNIDAQIAELLNQRASTAIQIGAAKAKIMPTYNPDREAEILNNRKASRIPR